MDFPPPYNPQNLQPPDLGYRYLGKNENLSELDEFHGASAFAWSWIKILNTEVKNLNYTYRRAICVDDPKAPPPDQWNIDGWQVFCYDGKSYVSAKAQIWCFVTKRWADWFYALEGYYFRYPDFKTQKNMKLKKGQSLIVKIGEYKPLLAAIKMLVEYNTTVNYFGYILIRDGRIQGHNGIGECYKQPFYREAIWLDARTEMGVIIDLLTQKPEVEPPKIIGCDNFAHQTEYVKNSPIVKFGFTEISIYSLGIIAKTMGVIVDDDYKILENAGSINSGNCAVSLVTLSTGVTLCRDQIKLILEYVNYVNTHG